MNEDAKINQDADHVNEDAKINQDADHVNEDAKINQDADHVNEDAKINQDADHVNEDAKIIDDFITEDFNVLVNEVPKESEDSKMNEFIIKVRNDDTIKNEDNNDIEDTISNHQRNKVIILSDNEPLKKNIKPDE